MRVAVLGGGVGSLVLATRLARAGVEAHWFRAPEPLPEGFVAEERGFRFDARPVPFAAPRPLGLLLSSELEFRRCDVTYGLYWADAALEVTGGTPRPRSGPSTREVVQRLRAAPSGRRDRPEVIRFTDAVRYASGFPPGARADRAEQVRAFDTLLWGGWVDPHAAPASLRPTRLFYPVGGDRGLVRALRTLLARHGGLERDASEVRTLEGTGGPVRMRLRGRESERFDEVLSHADRAHAFTSFHLPGPRLGTLPRHLDPTDWSTCVVLNLGLTRRPPALPHHAALLEPGLELEPRLWGNVPPQPIGLYVRHPTATDSSGAPPGGASLTVTCPLPRSVARTVDWRRAGGRWQHALISAMARQTGLDQSTIAIARLCTPDDFRHALRSSLVSAVPPARGLGPLLRRASSPRTRRTEAV